MINLTLPEIQKNYYRLRVKTLRVKTLLINCKLGECVRWGGGGGVVGGTVKGVQNLMGLLYGEIKIKHVYQYQYQQLSL